MMKHFMSAALVGLALGLSALTISPVRAEVTGTDTPAAGLTTQQSEQTPLQIMQAAIEQLIVDNKDDPDALKQAIEDYVANSDDPELAAQAVIGAITDPQSEAAKEALAGNASLADAVGQGLGAAIVTIGLTNPDAAAAMQASVDASGDESLVSAVTQGSNDKTTSIQQQQKQETQQQQTQVQVPEKTGSPL